MTSKTILVTCICAGIALAAACGDDEESNPGNNGNTANNNTANNNTANNNGTNNNTASQQQVTDLYDCESMGSLTACAVPACAVQGGYDVFNIICSSGTPPAYCDGPLQACLGTYVSCVQNVCPPGNEVTNDNVMDVQACADDFQACSNAATGG